MNIRLIDLLIAFKKERERIAFTDFNYFYGQMGAGKSTIARLIDYCLGGDFVWTPALQSEFVSVSLALKVSNVDLVLNRDANAGRIRAQWKKDEESFEVVIPARSPEGEIIPGTGVEVLSDLIFHLAGKVPPKVRRSKIKEDSELGRLSLRDLLWYCYLDQDSMDSSFFNLDYDANDWKRLKSRDVLRFLVGFHQEHVAELEAQLEVARTERLRCEAGAAAIRDALSSADLANELELAEARRQLEAELQATEREIADARNRTSALRPHAMETLQTRARNLAQAVADVQLAIDEVRDTISKDRAHRNELLSLSTRFRRSQSARAVLSGVEFKDCPRCGRSLPSRPLDVCTVCGQADTDTVRAAFDEQSAETDLAARVSELAELTSRQEAQLSKLQRQLRDLKNEKAVADTELTRASADYDSAYLSAALESEKHRSSLQQELLDLKKFEVLVQKISELTQHVHSLITDEQKIRSELREARTRAEQDTQNLSRLKHLFLDCLLRAKIPGFFRDDVVEMKSPNFLPEVTSAGSGDLAITSFRNLGSGGKKTLFKCCFAVAMHRLATEIGAMLPTLLIIDSPMKNISERENREQFEGFHQMLYDLSSSELKETQFILIDKELCPPTDYRLGFQSRHMKPDDEKDPPLIRYYRGK
jgi:rRNA maturation endonuclease Nob1